MENFEKTSSVIVSNNSYPGEDGMSYTSSAPGWFQHQNSASYGSHIPPPGLGSAAKGPSMQRYPSSKDPKAWHMLLCDDTGDNQERPFKQQGSPADMKQPQMDQNHLPVTDRYTAWWTSQKGDETAQAAAYGAPMLSLPSLSEAASKGSSMVYSAGMTPTPSAAAAAASYWGDMTHGQAFIPPATTIQQAAYEQGAIDASIWANQMFGPTPPPGTTAMWNNFPTQGAYGNYPMPGPLGGFGPSMTTIPVNIPTAAALQVVQAKMLGNESSKTGFSKKSGNTNTTKTSWKEGCSNENSYRTSPKDHQLQGHQLQGDHKVKTSLSKPPPTRPPPPPPTGVQASPVDGSVMLPIQSYTAGQQAAYAAGQAYAYANQYGYPNHPNHHYGYNSQHYYGAGVPSLASYQHTHPTVADLTPAGDYSTKSIQSNGKSRFEQKQGIQAGPGQWKDGVFVPKSIFMNKI